MNKRREPRLDLNPSSADRWTTCTASPRFILENWDAVPASSDTVYNQEGTTAHSVAANTLLGTVILEPLLPTPVDADMLWHGWNYAEYVLSLKSSPESKVLVEQKLPLWYMRERNCIIDAAVINPDSLHVVDYKYGEGVVVSPVENLQAAIYGVVIGSMGQPLPTDFPVFIHIYQPRGRASEHGAEHVWETTWLDLCRLTEKVTQVSKGIQDGTEIPMFAPSDKACQWCPAKGFCAERQKFLTADLEVIQDKLILPFDKNNPLDQAAAAYIGEMLADPHEEIIRRAKELEKMTSSKNLDYFPPAQVLSDEQIGAILKHSDQIVKWLNGVEEYALARMREGHTYPGFKLVQSRGGNRYWADPKKAEAELLSHTVLKREEIIEESMVSPAQIEEKIGKARFKAFANLTAKNPGAPVVAPEGDKRPALENAASDFEALPE